ncbi:MAG: hypothetical protein KF718_03285 [Polyangiaceae bacterium]|nr:hypothetical protein [Polyangiaceae bacterium]
MRASGRTSLGVVLLCLGASTVGCAPVIRSEQRTVTALKTEPFSSCDERFHIAHELHPDGARLVVSKEGSCRRGTSEHKAETVRVSEGPQASVVVFEGGIGTLGLGMYVVGSESDSISGGFLAVLGVPLMVAGYTAMFIDLTKYNRFVEKIESSALRGASLEVFPRGPAAGQTVRLELPDGRRLMVTTDRDGRLWLARRKIVGAGALSVTVSVGDAVHTLELPAAEPPPPDPSSPAPEAPTDADSPDSP